MVFAGFQGEYGGRRGLTDIILAFGGNVWYYVSKEFAIAVDGWRTLASPGPGDFPRL